MKSLGTVIILLFLFSTTSVLAAPNIQIINYPTELVVGQQFVIEASASGLVSNSQYYSKIRLGSSTSSLNKGQTNNQSNTAPDDWLSDSSSWSKFPQITSDPSGNWSGSLVGRSSDSVVEGSNMMVLRLNSSTNYDSSVVLVNIMLAPTPTPTEVPTPTVVPTLVPTPFPTNTSIPLPTKTPTPIPTQKPTNTPTPSHTPKPTPTVKPSATPKPSRIPTPEPTIVTASEFVTPTGEVMGAAVENKSSAILRWIGLILGGVGSVMIAVAASQIWQKEDIIPPA